MVTKVISVAERLRIGWVASSLRREPRGGVEIDQCSQSPLIALARIPTRDNLVSRLIVLDSNLYPMYSTSLEMVEHVFVDCVELHIIWSNISWWWNVPTPSPVSVESLIN
ncbi:hypothetical protein Tco_0377516 [Tanacetum coccineum]